MGRYTMERRWTTSIIVGICIALTVFIIQPIVARSGSWTYLLGLLAAMILVCAIQLLLLLWNRPRR